MIYPNVDDNTGKDVDLAVIFRAVSSDYVLVTIRVIQNVNSITYCNNTYSIFFNIYSRYFTEHGPKVMIYGHFQTVFFVLYVIIYGDKN